MAFDARNTPDSSLNTLSVLIVGTGFSGLGMAIRLKQAGYHDFTILERAQSVGGTWRDNRYPGCACDVQSHLYSFSFEQNPKWTRMYAQQPEIEAYLQGCAEKYGVMPHIRFGAELVSAKWDEAAALWRVATKDGRSFSARVLISGMGALSNPAYPAVPGIENFQGKTFHSAHWDHDYDLTGKRVAVIGTGASAIQFVPQIQKKVAHLDLYQRTPPWILPKPDREIPADERSRFEQFPILQRAWRIGLYWFLESRVLGFVVNPKFMQQVQAIAQRHINKRIKDPVLREKVTPKYTIGCKRVLISNDYYPALTQPNVDVVTDKITEVRAHSIIASDGSERPIDAIIYGTGFTVQNPVVRGTVFGRGGVDLVDAWKEGPEAYLGATVAGFPNLFFLMGPNTGLGHTSQVFMIEAQLRYVMDCLNTMKRSQLAAVEVKPSVYENFNHRLQDDLRKTIWSSGCKSWYVNDSGRNTTIWPGFTFRFRQKTRSFKPSEYAVTPVRALEQKAATA
jgi:cation diffusion facilitator CzcD-associated flavoprotein CzcO